MRPSTIESPKISIVLPAYREADRINDTVQQVLGQFDRMQMVGEVVVVDDGCPQYTAATVRPHPHVTVVAHSQNRGKGAAVRTGIHHSRGEMVGFLDVDLGGGVEVLAELARRIAAGADLVIGSRPFDRDHQSGLRRLCSAAAISGARLAGIRQRDTQCGAKLMTRYAAACFADLGHVDRFAFDLELLYVARRMRMVVDEVNLAEWRQSDRTTVQPLRDTVRCAYDLGRIVAHDMVGDYAVRPASLEVWAMA